MLGHKWHKAQAEVVLSRFDHGEARARGHVLEFVLDVRTQDGRFFRTLVQEPVLWPDFWPPTAGRSVGVEVEGDTQHVRFDKDDPRLSTREHERTQQSEVDAVLAQPPGSDPDRARPDGTHPRSAAAPEHPEWNHTWNMHNAAGRKPPTQHNLP